MMSSSADHSWVLGHCTQWTGGAQSAVGHTLYLVQDRASLSLYLYLGVIYANSLPPPGSSALLSPCPPHLGNLLKLAYYSAAVELLNYDIDTALLQNSEKASTMAFRLLIESHYYGFARVKDLF